MLETLLIAVFSLYAYWANFLNPSPKNDVDRWPERRLVLGHRGTRKQGPENTLGAVKKAFELGADGVEFDVLLTKDLKAVILHDDSLDRTTNVTGLLKDFEYAQLAQVNAAASWAGRVFEPIPT